MNYQTAKEIYEDIKRDKIMINILRILGGILIIFFAIVVWKAIFSPVKILGIELNQNSIIHDTFIQIQHDTIFNYSDNKQKPKSSNNDKVSVNSFNQKGGQTANQITNN